MCLFPFLPPTPKSMLAPEFQSKLHPQVCDRKTSCTAVGGAADYPRVPFQTADFCCVPNALKQYEHRHVPSLRLLVYPGPYCGCRASKATFDFSGNCHFPPVSLSLRMLGMGSVLSPSLANSFKMPCHSPLLNFSPGFGVSNSLLLFRKWWFRNCFFFSPPRGHLPNAHECICMCVQP